MKLIILLLTSIIFMSCVITTDEEEQNCYKVEPPFDTCLENSIILYADEPTYKNDECYFEYSVVPCNIDTWEKCITNSHTDDYCINI